MDSGPQAIRTSDIAAAKLFFEQLFGTGEEDGSGWSEDANGNWTYSRLDPPILLIDSNAVISLDIGPVSAHIGVRPDSAYPEFRDLLDRLNISYSIVGGTNEEQRVLTVAPGGAVVEVIFPRADPD